MQFEQNRLRDAVKLLGGGYCAVCVIKVTVLSSLEHARVGVSAKGP